MVRCTCVVVAGFPNLMPKYSARAPDDQRQKSQWVCMWRDFASCSIPSPASPALPPISTLYDLRSIHTRGLSVSSEGCQAFGLCSDPRSEYHFHLFFLSFQVRSVSWLFLRAGKPPKEIGLRLSAAQDDKSTSAERPIPPLNPHSPNQHPAAHLFFVMFRDVAAAGVGIQQCARKIAHTQIAVVQHISHLPLLCVGIVLLEALAGHLLRESGHAGERALPPHGLVVLIALLLDLRDAGRGVAHGLSAKTKLLLFPFHHFSLSLSRLPSIRVITSESRPSLPLCLSLSPPSFK